MIKKKKKQNWGIRETGSRLNLPFLGRAGKAEVGLNAVGKEKRGRIIRGKEGVKGRGPADGRVMVSKGIKNVVLMWKGEGGGVESAGGDQEIRGRRWKKAKYKKKTKLGNVKMKGDRKGTQRYLFPSSTGRIKG